MKTFWSYRLHKLGTLKCFGRMDGRTDGRPDGRSGPTTRPAFAKATQVKTATKTWMPSDKYNVLQKRDVSIVQVQHGMG